MKDTTFWPNAAQLSRLAKSYMAGGAGKDLTLRETPIMQLRYPLNDHTHRYAMPAGGLFSTAGDLGKYCQMLLNNGTVAGKRFLSEAAIRETARDQLSPAVKSLGIAGWQGGKGYGLGWRTGPGGIFYHPGAYLTDMKIDPSHGLATVWLIQHASFPGEGGKSEAAFDQAVVRRFVPNPGGAK
jgi:CubicO group peptidase (beta-lactamase class C family)